MDRRILKTAVIIITIIIGLLTAWYAVNVFLIAFAAILLAILLNTIGRAVAIVTHLPYPIALTLAIIFMMGILTLTFWLYSPLISRQFTLLIDQLPEALNSVKESLTRSLGENFLSHDAIKKAFSLSNERFVSQLFTVFSFTIGTIISFVMFLIVGLYLALTPERYVQWVLFLFPSDKKDRVLAVMDKIGRSLRWWLLGKFVSMTVIGILTFVGLRMLNVSLAFILGLLSALFTFIPYVGAIISAIPALLIAFTQRPLLAVYVGILYLVIHLIEGYMITPYIEQRTVSIPPALTILTQVLLLTLFGVAGFALATPLLVLAIALIQYSTQRKEPALSGRDPEE